MVKETVYLMTMQDGFGEHLPSPLDALTGIEINPTTIINALREHFPEEQDTFNIVEITEWLEEMMEHEDDEDSRRELPLFRTKECPHCGYDPEIEYELEYKREVL